MTDGTVVFADSNTNVWWRLTPDEFGGYEHGTWDRLKDGPSDYAPLYYGSATLPDGRLVVEGGEYNFGSAVWTTKGAIYDPVANTWTKILPPALFPRIGDASSVVLDDNSFMLTDCCDTTAMAILDPVSLTWETPVGDGKAGATHDEESWAKLRDGRIHTTDANNVVNLKHAEIYDPKTRHWSAAADSPVKLCDTNADNSGSHEVGPELLRLDGKVVAIGATGHNALYDPESDTWATLPDFPEATYQSADGPGAVLPNGDILVAVSPGVFQQPTHWYELHDATFTHLMDEPENAPFNASFSNFLIVLPTGEVLLSDFSTRVELYTPAAGFPEEIRPVIIAAPQLVGQHAEPSTAPITTLYRGRSYTVPVKRMNGVSFGAYYGDDAQVSTNFPLVRVTNTETGHVKYCRTYGHSDRSISPDEIGTTVLDIPATAEPGLSTFEVVANGIPSPAITVNIK
ncbi:MAG: hypothetical protein ABI678_06400, partial [Kofleriaceae bacterium]